MILLLSSQTPACMVSSVLPIDKKILKNSNGYLNLNHALIKSYLEEKFVLYPSDIRSHVACQNHLFYFPGNQQRT